MTNLKQRLEEIWDEVSGVDDELGVKLTMEAVKDWALEMAAIDHPEGIDNAWDWYQALDAVKERIERSTKIKETAGSKSTPTTTDRI